MFLFQSEIYYVPNKNYVQKDLRLSTLIAAISNVCGHEHIYGTVYGEILSNLDLSTLLERCQFPFNHSANCIRNYDYSNLVTWHLFYPNCHKHRFLAYLHHYAFAWECLGLWTKHLIMESEYRFVIYIFYQQQTRQTVLVNSLSPSSQHSARLIITFPYSRE